MGTGGADRSSDPQEAVKGNFCRRCGEEFQGDARFCRCCGAERDEAEPVAPDHPLPAGYPAGSGDPGTPYSPAPDYPGPAPGYPTQPPPGYAMQYAYTPSAVEPQPVAGRNNGWLIAGSVAAALAIAAITVGLYAAASGSSGAKTRLLTTPVLTAASSTASNQEPTPPGLPTQASTVHSPQVGLPNTSVAHRLTTPTHPVPHASTSEATARRDVASTIERHFSLISQHRFSAAYGLLAPSLQTGESSWVAAHREDGIYKVEVAVNTTLHSSTSATATIAKMTTLDGHGCKTWSGNWELTKISGQWRISKANVNPVPC